MDGEKKTLLKVNRAFFRLYLYVQCHVCTILATYIIIPYPTIYTEECHCI